MDVDSPDRITEKFPHKIIRVRSEDMFRLINDLRAFDKAESVFAFGQFAHFTGQNDGVEITELKSYLKSKNHSKIIVEEITPGIEDVFMGMQTKL